MAMTLHEQEMFEWKEFSTRLAGRISRANRSNSTAGSVIPVAQATETEYYTAWLESLQELLYERNIVTEAEVRVMAARKADEAGIDGRHH